MKILVTGPQGSGKTTQAEIIAKKLKLPFVKVGNLVRAKSTDGTKEADTLKKALETGEIADDSIVASLLQNKLSGLELQKGFVVDGYPRRISQLEAFDPHFDIVFNLDISDEVAKERLLKRGRVDDTPALIDERLRIFHKLTKEVLKYYQAQGILVTVEGEKSTKEVTKEIEKHLV